MLAAEFGYTMEYIDEYMDLPYFEAHLRYRADTPPVGMLLKALIAGFSKDKAPPKLMYGNSPERKRNEVQNDISEIEAMGYDIKKIKSIDDIWR